MECQSSRGKDRRGHDTYYESGRIFKHRVWESPDVGKRREVHGSSNEALASIIAEQAIIGMINLEDIRESTTRANLIRQASLVSLFFKKNTVSILED